MPDTGKSNKEVQALEDANALLKAMSRAQQHLIRQIEPKQLFDELLCDFIELTQSKFGFIGEILHRENGQPYLKTHSISNIAWDEASRTLMESFAMSGLEFSKLESLYGAVITSGEAVITDDPAHDPRSSGLPEGHPKIDTFLGVPVFFGETLTGMIGVANRPHGYDTSMVEYLKPLLETYAQIIEVHKANIARDKSSKKLNASENKFRSYVENASDALFLVRRDGKFIDVNQAACSSLGYRRDELLALTVFDISDTATHERIEQAWHSIEDGHPIRFEGIHRRKDDGHFPVEISFSLLKTNGDTYLMAQARDISARKETENKLRLAHEDLETRVQERTQHLAELNHLLEATFASMSEAVCVVDVSTYNVISCNRALEQIFGYSNDEIIGRHINLLHINHDHFKQFKEHVVTALNNNTPLRTEYVLKKKNGEIFPTEHTVTEIKDDKGHRKAFVNVMRDITERKQASEALKASEQRWRSLTQYSPDHIVLIDKDGIILFINHTLPELTVQQVTGSPITKYIPEKSHPEVQACFERVLTSGQPDRFESEYYDTDGTCQYFEAHVGPIMDKGEVTALIINSRNITKRKKSEEELRQFATVVKNTAEGVIVTDTNNNIIAVNRAFSDITGFTEDEALGQNPRLLKSEKHSQEFYIAIWKALETTGLWQGEIWDRRKNGEIFPAWTTISAVRNNEGILTNYVSVFSDISKIKHSQEQLDFIAHHDPLTNLPNRLLFNDRLDHALQRAERENKQIALLFLDLDRFKNINDSLGHPVGDAVLLNVAERLTNLVRKEDTVARLGGDEFILLVESVTDAQDVAQLAQKIIQTFNRPFHIKGHELHITVSAGISLYPRDGEDNATLIRNADAAMYRAKDEGRNDYQFYTTELTTAVFERLTLETALRHALTRNQLVLYYQPQYQLESGELVGVEALIRWQHPDMGLVGPSKFIPLAEESGQIASIGEWVLQQACQQMQAWIEAGIELKHIAVNVSGLQFQRDNFETIIDQALKQSGLDPVLLELEITEGYIMQNTKQAITVLDKIKKLGVTIAIDDFGTGYSSLSYLKRLPVDKLKIDKSFVRDIPQDSNDEAIARAIVALAHNLQLSVIAEGIETEGQRDFLKSLNCNEGQGFLFGYPLPADAFIKTFDQGPPRAC